MKVRNQPKLRRVHESKKINKAEVYLGCMESKHTTRFTRKKRAKNPPLCSHFNRFWHWKPCYYYIYIANIGHYFLPIAYVIFILTPRLVPVAVVRLYSVKSSLELMFVLCMCRIKIKFSYSYNIWKYSPLFLDHKIECFCSIC